MIKYSIRKAESNDFPQILQLIKDLAKFENAPEQVINSVEKMEKQKDLFDCFVVIKDENEIIGMALYFFAYFTWVGKSLYLDDLYVKPEYRGNGIGQELLQKIFEVAKLEQCSRLRWQVLNWNIDAIKLYKKAGATIDNEWSNCDFSHEQILKF
jgi:GNAT superfamily N-acetyltransferase